METSNGTTLFAVGTFHEEKKEKRKRERKQNTNKNLKNTKK